MCLPPGFACAPTHFPLLIDRAMSQVNKAEGEVTLSADAQNALYEHGSRHTSEFEAALKNQDPQKLHDLADELRDRLQEALDDSPDTDDQGRTYHPRRIDGEALRAVLKKNPWVP